LQYVRNEKFKIDKLFLKSVNLFFSEIKKELVYKDTILQDSIIDIIALCNSMDMPINLNDDLEKIIIKRKLMLNVH
jgi:hypothetical protein